MPAAVQSRGTSVALPNLHNPAGASLFSLMLFSTLTRGLSKVSQETHARGVLWDGNAKHSFQYGLLCHLFRSRLCIHTDLSTGGDDPSPNRSTSHMAQT